MADIAIRSPGCASRLCVLPTIVAPATRATATVPAQDPTVQSLVIRSCTDAAGRYR